MVLWALPVIRAVRRGMVKGRSRATRAVGAVFLAVTLGLAGLTGCTDDVKATPTLQSTAKPGIAPTPPKQGAYFGAWVESTDEERVGAVGRFEKDLGRQLDIAAAYRAWDEPFPQPADTALAGGNRHVLLNWDGADTLKIAAGTYDAQIRARARAVKALGKPVFLRWQRNMDARTLRSGRIHSAADFITAWKRLRRIFREEKADNVAWVWSPSLQGMGGEPAAATAFYPGDDQVDWIATDVFPGETYDYRDFSEAAHLFLAWAKKRPKPIMIAEFGVPRSYAQRRAEWLRKTAQYLQDPYIKAVVYFDSDEGGTDDTGRRRQRYALSDDGPAFSGLREMATTPYFNPRNLPVTPG